MRTKALRIMLLLGISLHFFCAEATLWAQGNLSPAFTKKVPDSLRDLQEIEKHVQKIVDQVMPATVCLRIGQAQGSGVIIDREGHILTAGHVSGEAGRAAVIILHDGRKIHGKTLGANHGIDSGMVIITEKVDFPHVAMALPTEIRIGQWCLALGHPGGYKPGRAPVVRLGRVQKANDEAIISDCVLVGGDSGGPLFDMHGQVIGIHSRIGGKISSNVHVPIATYHETWNRLAASEIWGNPPPFFNWTKPPEGYLGVQAIGEKKVLKIRSVTSGSPAEKAGLRMNDAILKVDNQTVDTVEALVLILKSKRPNTSIVLLVQRGTETVSISVLLGKRPG